MTEELVSNTMEILERIDTNGGMLKCIEEGWVQSQIMDSAYKYQREIEEKERIIVGVNKYQENEENNDEVTKINEDLIVEKIGKLRLLKEKRGNVEQHIDKISQYATTDENLMPLIIEAVNAKVSLGEICNALRKVWGEYKPKDII